MNQVVYKEIFNAIKSDNLVLFSSYFEEYKNISFGRFPLLSLCYLYNSKKLIKNYKKTLVSVNSYVVIDEYVDIYKKFYAVDGRNLRHYVYGDVVSPVEMLAILNKDSDVKKIFK